MVNLEMKSLSYDTNLELPCNNVCEMNGTKRRGNNQQRIIADATQIKKVSFCSSPNGFSPHLLVSPPTKKM